MTFHFRDIAVTENLFLFFQEPHESHDQSFRHKQERYSIQISTILYSEENRNTFRPTIYDVLKSVNEAGGCAWIKVIPQEGQHTLELCICFW